MENLELVVAVAAAVLVTGWTSRRTGLSEPLLLLGAGCLMGLTPPFDAITLSPEMVLLLFLPALLYWEALTSSVREIRHNLRTIALQSTVLVLVTALAVAPGLWPSCSARCSRRPTPPPWRPWPVPCPGAS
jgi:CPA1 family monovalent cation:H+ antiporter